MPIRLGTTATLDEIPTLIESHTILRCRECQQPVDAADATFAADPSTPPTALAVRCADCAGDEAAPPPDDGRLRTLRRRYLHPVQDD